MSKARESHGVGAAVPRVDGAAKVSGTAKYVDDLSFPEMLHGATVRSVVPSGTLRGFERDPDFDWSDVVVVTADRRGCNRGGPTRNRPEGPTI